MKCECLALQLHSFSDRGPGGTTPVVQVEVRPMAGACGALPWAFLPLDDRSRSLTWLDPAQVSLETRVPTILPPSAA